MKVSIVEIFNEEIFDLLIRNRSKRKPLKIRENKKKNFYIEGVKEEPINTKEEVFKYMKSANRDRATATTKMNPVSSRSHLVFMMTIN